MISSWSVKQQRAYRRIWSSVATRGLRSAYRRAASARARPMRDQNVLTVCGRGGSCQENPAPHGEQSPNAPTIVPQITTVHDPATVLPPSCKPTGRRRSPTRRATIGLTMQVSDDDRDPTYDDRNVTRRQTEYRGACEALLPLWLIGRFPPLPPPPTSSLGRLDQVYGIHA